MDEFSVHHGPHLSLLSPQRGGSGLVTVDHWDGAVGCPTVGFRGEREKSFLYPGLHQKYENEV